MAGKKIDSLSIEIGASAAKAVEDINKVTSALKSMKAAQQSVAKAKTVNLFQGLSSDSITAMSKIELLKKKVTALKTSLSEKMSLGTIDDTGIANMALQIKNAQTQVRSLRTELSTPNYRSSNSLVTNFKQIGTELSRQVVPGVKSFFKVMKQINSNAKKLISHLRSAASQAKKLASSILSVAGNTLKNMYNRSTFKSLTTALTKVKGIVSSLGRIAFYRMIRSAIKAVTDAIQEGTENAYWYSKTIGDSTKYISEAYDTMSSASFKMKNQIGAAWSTLVATIQPILTSIISWITSAVETVTKFFAILSGKSTYLKATDYTKDWAEATQTGADAAEEWKNQLMSFDEINRLDDVTSSTSGSGSSVKDYENMFEEAGLEEGSFLASVKEAFENGDWNTLGTLLGTKVNEIVNAVDWSGWGSKIGKKIQGAIETAYSTLTTIDFKNIGTKIASFLNNAGDEINFTTLGKLTMRIKTALWDVIYGAVKTINWTQLAIDLSDYILGSLTELSNWLDTLDPAVISNALSNFFGNIKYEEIKDKLKEVLKKAFALLSQIVGNLLPDDMGDNVKQGIVNAIANTDFAAIHNVLSYKLDKDVFGEKWANFIWSRGDYAGKEIVLGLISGSKSKKKDLEAEMEDVANTTKDVTERLLDIHSPSGVFMTIGENIIQGLWNGIKSKWDEMVGYFQGLWDNLSSWWNGLSLGAFHIPSPHFSWTYTEATGAIARALELVGLPSTIPHLTIDWYAQGGFPEDGLFMANHGELVGQFANGRTAVANNEQITAGIAEAVYDAFMTAFSQTGGNNSNSQPVNIYLDGRQIAKTTTKYQNQFARAGAY